MRIIEKPMNAPREFKININDYVTLKLTETGDSYVRAHPDFREKYAKFDKDGNWTEQLWVVMNILGGDFVNGGNQLIEKNIINATENKAI